MTAHYLIHEYRLPKPGDTVLIHAAAGGLGLLLVQWARHLGARVIGTVSIEEKAKAARAVGADEMILYTKQNFVAETKSTNLADLARDLHFGRHSPQLHANARRVDSPRQRCAEGDSRGLAPAEHR
jgi:NADPH:quinone reductase-like Zn-dependent oxidoreductase